MVRPGSFRYAPTMELMPDIKSDAARESINAFAFVSRHLDFNTQIMVPFPTNCITASNDKANLTLQTATLGKIITYISIRSKMDKLVKN